MNKCYATHYIMESPTENNRLACKVNPHSFVNKYLINYISKKSTILDVGCGPGNISQALGMLPNMPTVVPIDISTKRITEVRKSQNISPVAANAYEIPFKSNSFDFVFSRFLIEYMKNPNRMISEMYRVCKKDGRLFIQDLDGQFLNHYPVDTQLQKRVESFLDFLRIETGFDPNIGRKLYKYLFSNGFKNINVEVEAYHKFFGKISNDDYLYLSNKIDVLIPYMTKYFGSEQEANKLKKDYLDYLLIEETFTFSNLISVTGIKVT